MLEQKGPLITCDIIRWQDPYPPPVVELALRLNTLCLERGAGVLMLDGPQAWKADEHLPQPAHGVGQPGAAAGSPSARMLPGTYERFVGYCLALYDALGRLGWQRLAARESNGNASARHEERLQHKVLVESYPESAWKSLGITPLPERQHCRVSDLAEAYAALSAILPITTSQPPNHNQMQAIVGGLPGLAIEERTAHSAGQQKRRETELWSDGWAMPPMGFGVGSGAGRTVRSKTRQGKPRNSTQPHA